LDEAIRGKFHELSEQIIDATHSVTNLVEAEQPPSEDIAAANRTVAEIAARFAALVAELPEAERPHAERTHGRRVTDLRRLASRLPQKSSGQAARKAPDGGFPFLLQREPPKSIEPPRWKATTGRAAAPQYNVGGEVDAWCGTCGGLTNHHIVALVDGQPKQVICQSCNARHGYRTAPARSKAGATPAAVKPPEPARLTRDQLEAKRKEEARFALLKELAEATVVRPFSTKERYKAGEILQHPEHGRGKIENVLRGSLLVRFRDGLKSISMI
jgi:hypothetical protein